MSQTDNEQIIRIKQSIASLEAQREQLGEEASRNLHPRSSNAAFPL
jgi:hypothetical protein